MIWWGGCSGAMCRTVESCLLPAPAPAWPPPSMRRLPAPYLCWRSWCSSSRRESPSLRWELRRLPLRWRAYSSVTHRTFMSSNWATLTLEHEAAVFRVGRDRRHFCAILYNRALLGDHRRGEPTGTVAGAAARGIDRRGSRNAGVVCARPGRRRRCDHAAHASTVPMRWRSFRWCSCCVLRWATVSYAARTPGRLVRSHVGARRATRVAVRSSVSVGISRSAYPTVGVRCGRNGGIFHRRRALLRSPASCWSSR